MFNVLVVGAGKIGSLISCMLADSGDYQVHLADINFSGGDISRLLNATQAITTVTLDVSCTDNLQQYIKDQAICAILSSLPYYLTVDVAQAARACNVHYFDLTEDVASTKTVQALAQDAESAFIPQCGLAPGFIGIVAHDLMQEFEQCFSAKLRVGALPQRASNELHYSLTWSTDGIINEYGNPGSAIEAGKLVTTKPLEGLETIQIDGCEYEAFNTSGGLGGLSQLFENKIETLNYKTIRYPGHCEKMRFLMNDLRLNSDRPTLKNILEHAVPKTYQDLVIAYVSVEGLKQGVLSEKSYVKKMYPAVIHTIEWSAIQISTAAGICAVVDLVLNQTPKPRGFILQEQFKLTDILENQFGRHFA